MDGFFDGTLDDFFDDPALWALAGVALGSPRPPPPPPPSRPPNTSPPRGQTGRGVSLGPSTVRQPTAPRSGGIIGDGVGGFGGFGDDGEPPPIEERVRRARAGPRPGQRLVGPGPSPRPNLGEASSSSSALLGAAAPLHRRPTLPARPTPQGPHQPLPTAPRPPELSRLHSASSPLRGAITANRLNPTQNPAPTSNPTSNPNPNPNPTPNPTSSRSPAAFSPFDLSRRAFSAARNSSPHRAANPPIRLPTPTPSRLPSLLPPFAGPAALVHRTRTANNHFPADYLPLHSSTHRNHPPRNPADDSIAPGAVLPPRRALLPPPASPPRNPSLANNNDNNTTLPHAPSMSSSSRRRSIRAIDLTMPAVPTLARPPSRSSASRASSRPAGASQAESVPAPKRKRESEFDDDDDDDDLFGDKIFASEVVDLVDVDEVPPARKSSSPSEKSKARDDRIRLRKFDCVICMDKVKDLTVTHCGHLFCSECLHSALNMDRTKRVCPICRQKIDKATGEGRPGQKLFNQKAKGYYALELKFATKKSLGKKPGGRGGGGGGGGGVSGIV